MPAIRSHRGVQLRFKWETSLCDNRPESQLALSARELLPEARALARARQNAQGLLLARIGEPRHSLFGPGQLDGLLEQAGWRTVRKRARARVRSGQRGTLVLAEPRGSSAPGVNRRR